jgi:hypothetical protein
VRDLLPRGGEAIGVRDKLARYALNSCHRDGGPKARGFADILEITLDDIDYLDAQIRDGVLREPISAIRQNPPYGINCVVEIPVRGIGAKSDRIATVRTVWVIANTDTPPRLITAYTKV